MFGGQLQPCNLNIVLESISVRYIYLRSKVFNNFRGQIGEKKKKTKKNLFKSCICWRVPDFKGDFSPEDP